MMDRRPSLEAALRDLEAGTLGAIRIVVSRRWWDALSARERDAYYRRCLERGVALGADDRISAHFVEVVVGGDSPPLSSERRA